MGHDDLSMNRYCSQFQDSLSSRTIQHYSVGRQPSLTTGYVWLLTDGKKALNPFGILVHRSLISYSG